MTPNLLTAVLQALTPPLDPIRRRQRDRWGIWSSDFSGLVEDEIRLLYESDAAREGASRSITTVHNPAADVVTQIVQLYRSKPHRSILRGKSSVNESLTELYRESRLDTLLPDWSRIGYFVGPLFPVFRVVDGRMRVHATPPHQTYPLLSPDDPLGEPMGFATLTPTEVVTHYRDGAVAHDRLVRSTRTIHDHGKTWATFRLDAPVDPGDWSASRRHQRLVDGTIDVAFVAAVMGWVRKVQNKHLLKVIGNLSSLAKGQNLALPEAGIVAKTHASDNQTVQIDTIPFDTPVANFLEHIRFWIGSMAESTGVPVTISTASGKIDLEFAHDGVSELRDQQVVYATESELDMCLAMVQAARAGLHRLAPDLPTDDEIRSGFSVVFPRLRRRYADPSVEHDDVDWKLRKGFSSVQDELRAYYPHASDRQLKSILRDNLKRNGQWIDELTSRQLGGDVSTGIRTAAQTFGAMGPAAKEDSDSED